MALTEAIALGHDCGHGPAGHASEEAFARSSTAGTTTRSTVPTSCSTPLNLCAETLDAVRNHSWNRPAPATPEGEVVAWADRIAYVCHDFEDAVRSGIVTAAMLPPLVQERCGGTRGAQFDAFIDAVVQDVADTGRVGMVPPMAEALAEFRRFNYERIYMRPASVAQADTVVRVLRGLVEFYADRPNTLPLEGLAHVGFAAGSAEALREAVTYVAGMTDRFALTQAVVRLGWDPAHLPFAPDWRPASP